MSHYNEQTGYRFIESIGDSSKGIVTIQIVKIKAGHLVLVSTQWVFRTRIEITFESDTYNPVKLTTEYGQSAGAMMHGTDYGKPFHIKIERDGNDDNVFYEIYNSYVYW